MSFPEGLYYLAARRLCATIPPRALKLILSSSAEVPTLPSEDPAATTAAANHAEDLCPNCQREIPHKFCPHCGEARYVKGHLAFSHFSHHVAHEVIHLDSKIFRTLRCLFSSPGLLADDYLAGRRSRYISPLRFYLVCFAVMLFVHTAYHPIYDAGQLVRLDKSGQLMAFFHQQADRARMTNEIFLERVTERWHLYMSASEVIEPLILAGALALLYLRQKRYFAEHIIAALYFLAFAFLVETTAWVLQTNLGPPLESPWAAIWTAAKAAVLIPYLLLSLRRVYKEKVGMTSLKTAAAYIVVMNVISFGNGISLGLALVHTVLLRH